MIELVGSLLVPLQGTLPGWPEAQQPSVTGILFIVAAVPLAIGLVITFLGKGAELIAVNRGESGTGGPAVSGGSHRAELSSGGPDTPSSDQGIDADQPAPRRELRY